jgi:ribosome biogenesis GTPase A
VQSENKCPRNKAAGSIAFAAEPKRAKAVLDSILADKSPLVEQLACLRLRLLQERSQLAVLGQFKRGKSTFINALLGAPVLY